MREKRIGGHHYVTAIPYSIYVRLYEGQVRAVYKEQYLTCETTQPAIDLEDRETRKASSFLQVGQQ